MKLYATPLSHFSRKVRLLLDHYDITYEFINVGNVANADSRQFAGNPIQSVPVVQYDDQWLIDSDHIATHITRRFRPDDPYGVLTSDPLKLNARAVLNGIMANEVKLILGERTGLDISQAAYFQKAATTISAGLSWLESRAETLFAAEPDYLGFHLVCAWDHLAYYESSALACPMLDAVVAGLSSHSLVMQTAPARLVPKN